MNRSYLRFRLGHEWYAVSVREVVEVLPLVAITPLPEAPAHVLGALTLRGQAVTVIDLRRLLGQTISPVQLDTPLIILHVNGGTPLALLVDEVDNVITLTEALEALPSGGRLLAGMTRFEDTTLLVLQAEALASAATTAAVPHANGAIARVNGDHAPSLPG